MEELPRRVSEPEERPAIGGYQEPMVLADLQATSRFLAGRRGSMAAKGEEGQHQQRLFP